MKNYQLREDEVVLYKGNVTLVDKQIIAQLILTNLNIVFISNENEDVNVLSYPADNIKMYQGVPQIKVKGNNAEIYLLSTEIELKFDSKIELHKFDSAALKLLTGKTAAERCADKVKTAINKGYEFADETLGIESKQMVGNAIKNGGIKKSANVVGGIFGKFKK